MTFLNDLWKKFKETPTQEKGTEESDEIEVVEIPPTPKDQTPTTEPIVDAFQQNELETLESESVINNLRALKKLISEPKEEFPELRFSKIKKHLGEPEVHETVRQERWPVKIQCPNCRSSNLKRLAQIPPKNPHNHRYRCLNCGHVFNDDSETPMEQGIPPLNIWMQCWYLMGCTDSLTYIAAKLGLDIGTVEVMVRELQKIFNAKQPLTRFMDFEEWNKQSQHLRAQLKEDLLKQYERLNADIATAPRDTAEFRRQQILRRELSSKPKPPSPSGGKKR